MKAHIRRIRWVAISLGMLLLAMGLASCTLVFRKVAASAKEDAETYQSWPGVAVRENRKLILHMADDSRVEGRFMRLDPVVQGPEYEAWNASWYPTFAESSKLCLSLGDDIVLNRSGGQPVSGRLVTFDPGIVGVDASDGRRYISLPSARRIENTGGCVLSGEALRSLTNRPVPRPQRILVRGSSGTVLTINPDSVVQTTLLARDRRAEATLLGLLVDIGVLAAISVSDPQPDRPARKQQEPVELNITSCPLIASFSDRGFRYEAEPFVSAVAPGLRRTDAIRLDHAAAIDGRYTLKVSNPNPEIDYIDEISLRVVEHEPGMHVLPTQSGEVLTGGVLISPKTATDAAGRHLRNLVLDADSVSWISNPFDANTGDTVAGRRRLEVLFEGERFGDELVLVLRLQNTSWSSALVKRMVSELGDSLDVLSEPVSPGQSSTVRAALEREVALRVALWTGETWSDTGFIWPVGSVLPRLVAHRIQLPVSRHGDIRIQLDGPVGLWTIDQLAAVADATEASAVTNAPISEARDEHATDIRHALSSVDGDFFVMPVGAGDAFVSFEAPEGSADLERSVVLSSTGWYRVPTDDAPTPGLDAVAVVSTPGGVTAFIASWFEILEREMLATYASVGALEP